MYLGTSICGSQHPSLLGSFWAAAGILHTALVLVYRILNEEEVLLRELPGIQRIYEEGETPAYSPFILVTHILTKKKI